MAPTGVISWSQTAADNASGDSAVNFSEGQAPSSVNDSARALMASVAKWRDDISGILVTGGSGTAYTIASNQVQASNLNGMTVQFTPGTTNTGAVTLSVDSQTAKPIRFRTGVDLPAGVLISGSLYQATYRAAVEEWLLHSFDSSVYAIPIGSCVDFFGTTAPNGAFVLSYGQAISRTTYATLFSLFSTTFGAGDGSTTFNVPDLRGRVTAGKDDMGGSAASRITNGGSAIDGATLGSAGGIQAQTLTLSQIPTGITSANASQAITVAMADFVITSGSGIIASAVGGGNQATYSISGSQSVHAVSVGSNSISVTSNNTSGGSHLNVQPTIVANKLLRII